MIPDMIKGSSAESRRETHFLLLHLGEIKTTIAILVASLLSATMSTAAGGSSIRGRYPPGPLILSTARNNPPPERRIQQLSLLSEKNSAFVSECTSFLLSPDSLQDGVISQDEYASFLLSQCRMEGLCGEGTTLGFEQLSIGLQLQFVRGVCPYNCLEDRLACIAGLQDMWIDDGEFGFLVSETGLFEVNELVNDMCVDAYSDAVEMGLITRASEPTATNQPSVSQPTSSLGGQLSTPDVSNSNTPTLAPTFEMKDSAVPTNDPNTANPSTSATTLSSSAQTTSQSLLPSSQPVRPFPIVPVPVSTPTTAPSGSPLSANSSPAEATAATYAPVFKLTNMPSLQPNLFTPMSFVEQCTQSLLSPEAQQDGIVSHIEFADFFAHHCKKEGLCDDTFSIEFEELDVSLQLDFILLACSDSTEDCNDFDTFGVGVNDVEEVCSGAFEYALSKGLTSTFAPTANPSHAPSRPPFLTKPPSPPTDVTIIRSPRSDQDSKARKALVGLSAAVAVLFMAVGGVMAYHRSDHLIFKKNVPNNKDSNPNHFSAALYEHNYDFLSLPYPFSYFSSGSSSSSSSFRDARFVPVFDQDGRAIIQFNPNTANAVVIGSVTIGGGSSSISTGPFMKDEMPASKKNYISIGQVNQARSDASGSSSELSSLSSGRSASINGIPRRNQLFGSKQGGMKTGETSSQKELNSSIASGSMGKSAISRSTMPMTSTKFERRIVRFDTQVSFADWKAATTMISDQRVADGAVTGNYAMRRQSKFFFDIFTTPVSDGSSDVSGKQPSFHSLNINLLIPSVRSESDKSTEWVLGKEYNESFSEVPADEVLVPWRRGGFSTSLKSSDGGPEGSECSKSFYMHQLHKSQFNSKQGSVLLIRPLGNLLKSVKAGFNCWFKKKSYQDLLEDPSVISMQSYSSKIHLLPRASDAPAFGLPGLILGTFAAASMPVEKRSALVPSKEMDVETGLDSVDHLNKSGEAEPTPQTSHIVTTVDASRTLPPPTLGIERRDDDNASFSSDFESSTGWSTSSAKHSSLVSSCTSASMYESASAVSSDKSAHTDSLVKHKAVDLMNMISDTLSESESTNDSKNDSSSGTNKEDERLNSSNSSEAGEEEGMVNVVSDSSGSFNSEEVPSKQTEKHMDTSHAVDLYEESLVVSHTTQRAHDKNFFMMLSGNIMANASSVDDNSNVDNGDWSHNVSESTSSSSSCDTEDSTFNTHSLSLSLESGADSASQAIDWAISREASKQLDSTVNVV